MTLPQIDFLLIWVWIGITLQALESFFIVVENRLVGHPDLFRKGFDLSERISRVVTEVKPHEDWLLLHPLRFAITETTVSRCEYVCSVLDSECVKT